MLSFWDFAVGVIILNTIEHIFEYYIAKQLVSRVYNQECVRSDITLARESITKGVDIVKSKVYQETEPIAKWYPIGTAEVRVYKNEYRGTREQETSTTERASDTTGDRNGFDENDNSKTK